MSSSTSVQSLSVNEEGTLFAACTSSALVIFSLEPLAALCRLPAETIGTVSIARLLHRTNLIALVAGGPRPKFADSSVLIWDDAQKRLVLELTFAGRVLALRTTRDQLLIVVEQARIHLFGGYPARPERLHTLATGDNPLGLCEVTPSTSASELQLLAFPGARLGSVQLLDLAGTANSTANSSSSSAASHSRSPTNTSSSTSASVSVCPTSISAHQSEVACLALNRTGRLLATASRKGTLIRLFRTVAESASGQTPANSTSASAFTSNNFTPLSPQKVAEFRRGLDTVTLYGLLFSPDSEFLLAWSDKGTVHLFALPTNNTSTQSSAQAQARGRSGSFSAVGSLIAPLVSLAAGGEYSLSRFSLPAESRCVCAFAANGGSSQHSNQPQPQQKCIYALCLDGTYHKYAIAKDGAACERLNFDNYLEAASEESEQEQLLS